MIACDYTLYPPLPQTISPRLIWPSPAEVALPTLEPLTGKKLTREAQTHSLHLDTAWRLNHSYGSKAWFQR